MNCFVNFMSYLVILNLFFIFSEKYLCITPYITLQKYWNYYFYHQMKRL